MLKYPQLVGELRIAALRGCVLHKISPLEVGNSGSFFWSLLIVACITGSLDKFTFALWTRSAAGSGCSDPFHGSHADPAHGKVLSSFLLSLTRGTLCLVNIICSQVWRHATTSPGRLPAIRSATAVEAAVWVNLPTVSLICVLFILFLSHHPSDATCDVTGCSPPSWWRSASLEAAASHSYSAYRCCFHLKVRDVPICSLTLTDAL